MIVDQLNWEKTELISAVVQDAQTKDVLMIGMMNRDALVQTLELGEVVFYSRTKERLWKKGESSGNVLKVQSITPDCDADAILIQASPAGPTCHTLRPSCFEATELATLENTVKNRQANPDKKSYTNKLFKKGKDTIAKKIGEEGVEVAIAIVSQSDDRVIDECADLFYHLAVGLRSRDLGFEDVFECLAKRRLEE